MIDLVYQPAHDVVEKRHLLNVEAFGTGNEQICHPLQDSDASADVPAREGSFQLVEQRLVAGCIGAIV